MAKLKVTFVSDPKDKSKNVEWVLEHMNKDVTQEQAQKALQRLKRIEYLLKSNGEPLYTNVKEINAEVLEESAVLSISNV